MAIVDRRTNQFVEDKDTRVSVGIDFPLTLFPNQDGYFKTTKTTIDSIKNNIKLLLQTQRGERVFQPSLGMNVKRFIFEQIDENTEIEIENDIVDTFKVWMPFVDVRDIEVNIDSSTGNANRIGINIVFSISRAPNSLESVGVVLE
jgi:phage baseplate assembly protein W